MDDNYIFCHLRWVETLIWRLFCQENDFGICRGLTVEEYNNLKPKVEKLTIRNFAQIKKLSPSMTGPSKEEIQKQIEYVKERFKDLEAHPEKLGKTIEDITYKEEDWWRPAKPGDIQPIFGHERIWDDLMELHTGFAYVSCKRGEYGPSFIDPSSFNKLGKISEKKIAIPEEWAEQVNGLKSTLMEMQEIDDEKLMEQAIGLCCNPNKHTGVLHQIPKTLRLEIELTYPGCDHYSAKDAAEFVKENIQDWLNANLSDGDDRLRLVNVKVKSDNHTIEIK